jgi:hypothetical protein
MFPKILFPNLLIQRWKKEHFILLLAKHVEQESPTEDFMAVIYLYLSHSLGTNSKYSFCKREMCLWNYTQETDCSQISYASPL